MVETDFGAQQTILVSIVAALRGLCALLNFPSDSFSKGASPDAPLCFSCHFPAAQESRSPTEPYYSKQQGL